MLLSGPSRVRLGESTALPLRDQDFKRSDSLLHLGLGSYVEIQTQISTDNREPSLHVLKPLIKMLSLISFGFSFFITAELR